MPKPSSSIVVACLVLVLGGQTFAQTSKAGQAAVKQLTIPAVTMTYQEQGRGDAVVFVHGAFADHRIWEMQREAVAEGYHFIAVDLRHHGTRPWPTDVETYSEANYLEYTNGTFAYDLAELVRELGVWPVHLVGHSSGGNVVIDFALEYPELLRSLVLIESGNGSIVTDPEDLEALEAGSGGQDPIFAAIEAGEYIKAVRLNAEWVNGQPGSFDKFPQWLQTTFIDNSRTLLMHRFLRPFDPPLTCAELNQIQVPVTVIKGERTRVVFDILADTTHSCIPGSQLVEIPNASHLVQVDNPTAFNKALLNHLKNAPPIERNF